MISRSADYFITCYTVLLNKTQQGRNSCPRLQFLAFSLGSIMSLPGPLSFLRSISLISLFSSLSIFGWADLLQILSVIAAFSLAVLFIIVFELSSIFGGLYALSDPICCSFLTWFNYDFLRDSFCLSSVSLSWQRHAWYSGFFLLFIVTRFAFDIGQICNDLDLSFIIWGHHRLH